MFAFEDLEDPYAPESEKVIPARAPGPGPYSTSGNIELGCINRDLEEATFSDVVAKRNPSNFIGSL